MTRVFLVVFALMTAAAGAMTWYGIAAQSATYTTSVRSGSAGGIGYVGGVK